MVDVSVVMPTYNAPVSLLREAVNSILSQTFRSFELIIVDDCSTNESADYLRALKDERIRFIRNSENLGVTKSLNVGFQAARGKYIARMDDDDISLPIRLEKQFAFMETHPDVILCGSNIERFGEGSGKTKSQIRDMESYRIRLLFRNPGPCHPTAFFNRELLLRHHLSYDERLIYAQDYGLYTEISKYGKIHILKDVLLRHRIHSGQISISRREQQIQCDKMTQKRLLTELMGDVSGPELDLHYYYSTGYYQAHINRKAIRWYRRLIAANRRVQKYDQAKLKKAILGIIVRRTWIWFGLKSVYLRMRKALTLHRQTSRQAAGKERKE